jgi:hypothetical protein
MKSTHVKASVKVLYYSELLSTKKILQPNINQSINHAETGKKPAAHQGIIWLYLASALACEGKLAAMSSMTLSRSSGVLFIIISAAYRSGQNNKLITHFSAHDIPVHGPNNSYQDSCYTVLVTGNP